MPDQFYGLSGQNEHPVDQKDLLAAKANLNPGAQGQFAMNPLMTPKYMRQSGWRDAEYKDTLARLYVSFANESPAFIKQYIKLLPTQAQNLGRILTGTASGNGGSGFINFFLTQANESWSEVVQAEPSMMDNYVTFFFGQNPPTFAYSGYLINSKQDDQRLNFVLAYQHLLRGSRCARSSSIVRIRYDDVIVSGYVVNMSQTLDASNELLVPFNFSILVKEYLIVTPPIPAVSYAVAAGAFSEGVSLPVVGGMETRQTRHVIEEITSAANDPSRPAAVMNAADMKALSDLANASPLLAVGRAAYGLSLGTKGFQGALNTFPTNPVGTPTPPVTAPAPPQPSVSNPALSRRGFEG